MEQQHTLSVLVENEFGVLSRVAGLFSTRGFNIDCLSVAEDPIDPTVSRITLVTTGDDQVVEQITKQLHKLVNVILVRDFVGQNTVDRELTLIKVAADENTRSQVVSIVDIFRAKIVDVSPKSYVIEVTGDRGKVQAMIELLKPLGILEIARTGRVTLARGAENALQPDEIVESGEAAE